jgi:hypothetical protein
VEDQYGPSKIQWADTWHLPAQEKRLYDFSMKTWTSICLVVLTPFLIPNAAHAWQMKQAPLMSQWANQVDTNAPLPEYPRPQMVRKDWQNLNGIWQFQAGDTNDAVPAGKTLSEEILVPFPMESPISGVMAYHPRSWYRRTFTVPPAWRGKRIILHLDAVDWESEVFINGASVGIHKGGYDPISYDITGQLKGSSPQELIVRVYDPTDDAGEARGKQTLSPGGIMYASSSGIWQPVWIEPVAAAGISDLKIVPDVDNARLNLTVNTLATDGVSVSVTVSSNGVPVATVTGAPNTELNIAVPKPRLWTPDQPFLYDLKIATIQGGTAKDTVTSYFGMRKISVGTVDGIKKMLLNNQFVFQIGPLDQGFWPDGNYTAPTDAALRYDIEQEKALGFNMVRKHIKVERARWYYWADKLGILVWQDMPSANSYISRGRRAQPLDNPQFRTELIRMVETHWNSPAIIVWVLFNESQGQHDTADLVNEIAAKDPSRLVNQASGGRAFGVGDIMDVHSYPHPNSPTTTNQVRACGEFGGIAWHVDGHLWNPTRPGTSYVLASSLDKFATMYDGFINEAITLKSDRGLSAAVYTEITDVENECNGLLTYDRVMKADVNKIRTSNRKAITALLTLTTVVPASRDQGITWKYTTNTPAADWFATKLDDAGWASGQAGFGSEGRTPWSTSDIWIRREFALGSLTPKELDQLVFNCWHNSDCEVYINGVLAAKADGRSTTYTIVPIEATGKAALVQNGTNIFAVHCHRNRGGQFIDVGLSSAEFHTDPVAAATGLEK